MDFGLQNCALFYSKVSGYTDENPSLLASQNGRDLDLT